MQTQELGLRLEVRAPEFRTEILSPKWSKKFPAPWRFKLWHLLATLASQQLMLQH